MTPSPGGSHRDSGSDPAAIGLSDPSEGETVPAKSDRPGRFRRWWWLVAAATLIAATLTGWLIGRWVQSPEQVAASAAPPDPSWVTTPVERRILSQTVIARGDVRPQASLVVMPPVSVEGEPVVTAIGVAVGDEVAEGQRLMEVSGRPVFVLAGDVPAYRSLRPGMVGVDVEQVQAALIRLGCPNDDEPGLYGPATKSCVNEFYRTAGYEPLPSSPSEAADLAAAEQAVADAEFTLAEIRANPAISARSPTLARAVDARDRAVESLEALRTVTGPTIPQGEVVFVSALPVRVGAAIANLGPIDTTATAVADGSAEGQLVRLDVGDLVVTTALQGDDESLVRSGMAVELLDEQSNTRYPAAITSIDDTPTTGPDGLTGYIAVISPEDPLPPSLTGINLRVTITAAATETESLVVPLAAISSAADGTTFVSVLPPGTDDPILVEVTAGLSADGFVVVEPARATELSEGDRVVVGR